MGLLSQYGKEIVAILVPFVAWALNVGLRPRARLNYSLPHQWNFIVQEPLLNPDGTVASTTQTVRTGSVFIQNNGREPAKALEVVFNWEPKCFSIWPPRRYNVSTDGDGRYSAVFDSLAPSESLVIEILDINRELPNLVAVRSEQSTAKQIVMYPQPDIGRLRRALGLSLMALGASTSIYLAILIVQFLVLRTPVGR